MASSQQKEECKRDGLGTPVDEMFAGWSDSDDDRNTIHVHNGDGTTPSTPNSVSNTQNNCKQTTDTVPHLPSSHQHPSSIPLDNIVSTLFDLKTYINDKAKVITFERQIDLLLLKFNDMQSEKFNLLQQINNLEKENDALSAQLHQNDKDNDTNNSRSDDEFKGIEFTGLETEQSLILVDYWNDKKKKQKKKKSSIAPWTKYYNRHKQGIGEDLRIAIISSQKLQNVKTYNDTCFVETLQSIEMKCYFPKLFKALREIYGVSLQDFIASFKCNHLLEINQCQSSLSGSQFFYSFDGKYIIKSMRREEVTFIKEMIYKYYQYIDGNKNGAYINRFYAMFKVVNTMNDNIINAQINKVNTSQHFIIMDCIYYDNNMDDIPLTIYDLKGSKYNRITEKQNNYEFCFSQENRKRVSILKDHEWMEKCPYLEVSDEEQQMIKDQLFKDIQFLKSLEIMDYSLLIAVYDQNQKQNHKKRNKKHKNCFIGIIDFLQHFTFWKQMEGNGAYYILGIDGYDIVDPEQYANRLWKFVCDFVFPSCIKMRRL